MRNLIPNSFSPSRRDLLVATAATAASAIFPARDARSQPPARHRRLNLSDPGAAATLASYKKAIQAMLDLPPSDPRNWYRQAFTHTIDCPHGNWWFLVWHRGYIGWFEQICRELSGDPNFALPYWDWTKEPRVPAVMFDDVLTPTHSSFIGSFSEFEAQFKGPIAQLDCWKSGPPFDPDSKYAQLLVRGLRFPDDLWFDINKDPRGALFFDRDHARGLTKDKPDFDTKTTLAVSQGMLLDALSPRDFITFGSPKTFAHSGLTGFGILEGQPHNKVHNCVGGVFTDANGHTTDRGGFMQANLSPVDPLFFLHHANIDRLWDVWTRKQQARRYPILPDGFPTQPGGQIPKGSDYELWAGEPFLFFVDAKGNPVGKTQAGDYATIGDFDYDYQPGSGEEVVPVVGPVAAVPQTQSFSAGAATLSSGSKDGGTVALPSALFSAGTDAPKLFAKITLALPPLSHAGDIAVTVDAPGSGLSTPGNTITLSMFGHHTIQGPVTFTIPLREPLKAIRANKRTTLNALNFRVQPAAAPPQLHAHAADSKAQVLSIVVEAH